MKVDSVKFLKIYPPRKLYPKVLFITRLYSKSYLKPLYFLKVEETLLLG